MIVQVPSPCLHAVRFPAACPRSADAQQNAQRRQAVNVDRRCARDNRENHGTTRRRGGESEQFDATDKGRRTGEEHAVVADIHQQRAAAHRNRPMMDTGFGQQRDARSAQAGTA